MLTAIVIFLGYFSIVFIVKNSHHSIIVTTSKKEREHLHLYYHERFSFYKKLTPSRQRKFLYRVFILRKSNKIKVHEDIKHVHQDIELMINAAFAQITFGYTDFTISTFSKLIIYPDSFYSKLAGAHVNGLTVGKGFIYLSWNHFLKGYQNNDDKINLALHELAHAIYIDRFHFRTDLDWFNWEENAERVFHQIRNNDEILFFRAYAKTSMSEFWAVCVECFFEDPANFKSEFPDLYKATAQVLNQDLLR